MSPLDIDRIMAGFCSRFRAAGDPERARFERRYHKTEKLFHGVSALEIRCAARDFKRAHRDVSRKELFCLCDALWQSDYFDLRSLAIALHEAFLPRLESSDMPRLESMLRDSAGWGHVDWICVRLVDPLIAADPGLKSFLERWGGDDNFWMRRSALLGQLIQLRRGAGDFDLFAHLAGSMLHEKEFFIRKAIGWVLREVSKKRPHLSYGFLLRHLEQLSPLTFREGSRRLPPQLQEELQRSRAGDA